MHLGHAEARIALGAGFELGRRRGFQTKIEFAPNRSFEMLDDVAGMQSARRRRKRLDQPGGQIEGIEIPPKVAFDVGSKHLDGDLLPCLRQTGPVDLCDRRGRDGFRKFGKYLIDLDFQLLLDCGCI